MDWLKGMLPVRKAPVGYNAEQGPGMLSDAYRGTGAALPPQVRAAIMRLRAKGVPVTKANIAEEIALGGNDGDAKE
jgi:hypothetical protein